jgi:hypothetical protein
MNKTQKVNAQTIFVIHAPKCIDFVFCSFVFYKSSGSETGSQLGGPWLEIANKRTLVA